MWAWDFCKTKQKHFWFSVTHLILRFTIVQNKFQQTNKTRINHINDYHIKFGFLYIFGRSGLLFGFAAVCWLVAADKANNYYSRSRKLPWSVAGLTTSRRFHSELSKANVYITQNETTTANEKKCQYLCLSWNALKPQCRFVDNSIFANDQFYRLFFFRNTNFYVN